jgi:hypothetical protein
VQTCLDPISTSCSRAAPATAWAPWAPGLPLMLALQLMPAAGQNPDARSFRLWRERLGPSSPYLLSWHRHRHREEYSRSRAIEAERIEVPAFLIGRWRELFPRRSSPSSPTSEPPRARQCGRRDCSPSSCSAGSGRPPSGAARRSSRARGWLRCPRGGAHAARGPRTPAQSRFPRGEVLRVQQIALDGQHVLGAEPA